MKSFIVLGVSLLLWSHSALASYISYDKAEFYTFKNTDGKLHRSFLFKGPLLFHSDTDEVIPISNKTDMAALCSAVTRISSEETNFVDSGLVSSFPGFGPFKPALTNHTKTALLDANGSLIRVVTQTDKILQEYPDKGVNLAIRDLYCNYRGL